MIAKNNFISLPLKKPIAVIARPKGAKQSPAEIALSLRFAELLAMTKWGFYVFAVLIMVFSKIALAEVSGSPAVFYPGSREQGRITLSLRDIDIIEALKFFSLKTGFNIMPTRKVTGRVTLSVEDAVVQDVFDIMLRSNSLAYDKRGDIYNVMLEEEYRAIYGKNFYDAREVKVFRLKYVVPEQAFNLLDALKSSIGRLLVESESGTVLMMDTPEKLAEAQTAMDAIEQKSSVKVFGLKYAKASAVEVQLKAQLDAKKAGTVRADERTNQVIVQTLPERMENIEELVKSLDKKTRAVLIDTKIIKIKLSNQLDTGIEWEGIFKLAKKYGMNYMGSSPFSAVQSSTASWASRKQFLDNTMKGDVGAYPFSGTTSNYIDGAGGKISPGEKVHIGVVDNNKDYDIILKYLQTIGKTRILSNPTLSVVENQEANIHVGERRAYITTTTTIGSTTETTSEDVTYVDVGIKLSLKPTINDDGYVTIDVKPEISSVIDYLQTAKGNKIPIIDTSTAQTTVIAKDGSTIILGGLGREEKTETTEQVPVLGSIPLLGYFFRSKTQKTERSELLILLTPVIFEGDRLITAQDKENELFGVKKLKKFDAYKDEFPREDAGSLSLETAGKKSLLPKGLRTYELEEELFSSSEPSAGAISGDTRLSPKGLKAYIPVSKEEIIPDMGSAGGLEIVKEKKEVFTIKDFRAY